MKCFGKTEQMSIIKDWKEWSEVREEASRKTYIKMGTWFYFEKEHKIYKIKECVFHILCYWLKFVFQSLGLFQNSETLDRIKIVKGE